MQIRYNDSTITLAGGTKTNPALVVQQNNMPNYFPLIQSGTDTLAIDNFVYVVSGPTLCVRYNNKTYKVPTEKVYYDITAGTYTPSAFKNLIENYISPGGSRSVRFDFTVIVNNMPVNVHAGDTIYYNQVSSGSNQARLVGFGYNGVGMGGSYNSAIDFINYKQYCVWDNHLGTTSFYQTYENFSITIQSGGIKFN